MPYTRPSDVPFLGLSTTVFCVECELISYNNSPRCLFCGSQAILSLARVLGGSLAGETRASLVSNDTLNRVVRSVLGEVMPAEPTPARSHPRQQVPSLSNPALSRPSWSSGTFCADIKVNQQLEASEPAVRAILDQACTINSATGAVLALRSRGKMLCVATMGTGVPELGSTVGETGSLSALCVKTATTLRCDSPEDDARVDQQSCRELGVQSVVAAPVAYMNQVVGLLEIFSQHKYAFANQDVAKVQLLASLILMALMKSNELMA
jgi:hypothetical protein